MSATVHAIANHNPKSPQLGKGYLRLSNELHKAICRAHLSGNELAVLLAVAAKTYGFNKKTDDVSASQLGEYCDIARNHVTEVLKSLEARNIITKRPGTYGSIIGIQKDYSLWLQKEKRKESINSPSYGLAGEVVRNSDVDSPKLGQVDSPKLGHTKDNLPKDNQQKTKTSSASSMLARFDAFWLAYPKKVEKKDAKAVFLKIAPDDEKLQTMLQAIDAMKRSGHADDKRFIASPAKWLRGERWNDEIQVAYNADELAVIAAYNNFLADVSGEIDPLIFSDARAGAIRQFCSLSEKPKFWNAYFHWVAANASLPLNTGFDWLISRDGFSKVKGGQFNKR